MIKLLLLLFFFLVPEESLSQVENLNDLLKQTNERTDLATKYLYQMFGFIMDPNSPGGALSGMLLTFNNVMLMLAALFLSYNFISGVAQTAHEGKLLGRRWNSMWAPLRVVLGISMLAPLPLSYDIGNNNSNKISINGINGAQMIVIKVAEYGIGFANYTWNTVVDAVAMKGLSIIPPSINENIGIIKDFMQAEVCAQNLSATYRKSKDILRSTELGNSTLPKGVSSYSNLPLVKATSIEEDELLEQTITWDYGDICGKISFNLLYNKDTSTGKFTTTGMEKVKESAISYIGVGSGRFESDRDTINIGSSSFLNIIHNYATRVVGISHSDSENYISDIEDKDLEAITSDQLIESTLKYYSYLQKNIIEEADLLLDKKRKKFIRDAETKGFLTAGAYYNELAIINSELSSKKILKPSLSSIDLYQIELGSGRENLVNSMNVFESWWDYYFSTNIGKKTKVYSSKNIKDITMGNLTLGELKKAYKSFELSELWKIDFIPSVLIVSGSNPMSDLTTIGHGMMFSALGNMLYTAKARSLIHGVAEWGKSTPLTSILGGAAAALNKFGDILSKIITPLMTIIMIAGSFLSYYLPLIPYIIWTFAVIAYFAFIIEAIIAAPLWAFAHIRMDGESLVGNAAVKGYQFLFNMFMRPTLMIIGLIMGFVLFQISCEIINDTYLKAVHSNLDDTITGLFGIVLYSVLLVIVYINIADLVFSLIHEIPNRVTDWVGASDRGIGDGKQEANKTRALIHGAVTAGITQTLAKPGDSNTKEDKKIKAKDFSNKT